LGQRNQHPIEWIAMTSGELAGAQSMKIVCRQRFDVVNA